MIIQGHLLFQYIQDKKKRKQFKNRMYLQSKLYLPCPSPLSSLSFYDQKLHRICFFNQKIKFASVNPTSVPSRGWAAAVSREITIFLTQDPRLRIFSNAVWLEFTLEVEGAPWGDWFGELVSLGQSSESLQERAEHSQGHFGGPNISSLSCSGWASSEGSPYPIPWTERKRKKKSKREPQNERKDTEPLKFQAFQGLFEFTVFVGCFLAF